MPSDPEFDPCTTGGPITAEFVRCWSARYRVTNRERDLFERIGPAVADRRHYYRDEFLEVARWKSPRSATYVGRNRDEDIEEITGLALVAPERLRHRILSLLDGVRVPMASALLAVCYPRQFTVVDFRAIKTLQLHRELDDAPAYPVYLDVCRAVAERVGTDLRTLDRALWQRSKECGTA